MVPPTQVTILGLDLSINERTSSILTGSTALFSFENPVMYGIPRALRSGLYILRPYHVIQIVIPFSKMKESQGQACLHQLAIKVSVIPNACSNRYEPNKNGRVMLLRLSR